MNMELAKTVSFLILSLFLITGVLAVPDDQFEVYGTVTDTVEDDVVEGVTVKAYSEGVVEDVDTDSDGYYSLVVDSGDFDRGEEFDVRVEDETGFLTETVEFQSFQLVNVDFEGEFSETEEDQEEDEDETDSTTGGSGDQDESEDEEQEEQDDQEDEDEEDVVSEVNASVDGETGEASSEYESEAGERVRTNIPESVDPTGSSVESVEVTSSTSQNIRKSVREVDDDSELQEQGIERREDQISVEEINVEGEVEDATITFSVSKDRLEERNAGPENVFKQRYNSDIGEWEDLDTRHLEELDDRHRFEADVTEFSFFATRIESREDTTEVPWSYLTILIVLLAVLAAVAYKKEDEVKKIFGTLDKTAGLEVFDPKEKPSQEEVDEVIDESAKALREAVDDIEQAEKVVEEALNDGADAEELEGLIGDVIEEEEDALRLLNHLERISEE